MKYREKYEKEIEQYDRMVTESKEYADIVVLRVVQNLIDRMINDEYTRYLLVDIINYCVYNLMEKEVDEETEE